MGSRSTVLRMAWLFGCALVFAVLLVRSAADAASAAHERLLEGAKKEGRLVLYTGMDTEEANQYMHEFTKKYPFVKPEAFRSSGEKVQARFLIEHRANVHNADIFQASIVQVYQLKNAGLLGKYISDESQVYPEGFKDPLGYWTAFYLIPYVIGHNTKLVSTQRRAERLRRSLAA